MSFYWFLLMASFGNFNPRKKDDKTKGGGVVSFRKLKPQNIFTSILVRRTSSIDESQYIYVFLPSWQSRSLFCIFKAGKLLLACLVLYILRWLADTLQHIWQSKYWLQSLPKVFLVFQFSLLRLMICKKQTNNLSLTTTLT